MAFFVSLLDSLEVISSFFFSSSLFCTSARSEPAGGSIPARMLRVHMRSNCLILFSHIHDPYLFISQEKPLKAKRTNSNNNNNNKLKNSSSSQKLTKWLLLRITTLALFWHTVQIRRRRTLWWTNQSSHPLSLCRVIQPEQRSEREEEHQRGNLHSRRQWINPLLLQHSIRAIRIITTVTGTRRDPERDRLPRLDPSAEAVVHPAITIATATTGTAMAIMGHLMDGPIRGTVAVTIMITIITVIISRPAD